MNSAFDNTNRTSALSGPTALSPSDSFAPASNTSAPFTTGLAPKASAMDPVSTSAGMSSQMDQDLTGISSAAGETPIGLVSTEDPISADDPSLSTGQTTLADTGTTDMPSTNGASSAYAETSSTGPTIDSSAVPVLGSSTKPATSTSTVTALDGISPIDQSTMSQPPESEALNVLGAKKDISTTGSAMPPSAMKTPSSTGKKEGTSLAERLKRRVSSTPDKNKSSMRTGANASRSSSSPGKVPPATVATDSEVKPQEPIGSFERTAIANATASPAATGNGTPDHAAVPVTIVSSGPSKQEATSSLGVGQAPQPATISKPIGAGTLPPPATPKKNVVSTDGTPVSAKTNDFKTAPSTPSTPSGATSGTPGTDRKRTKSGFFSKLRGAMSSPK